MKPTILIVAGTRPELIKLAPVIIECRKHLQRFNTVLCLTGQHREMTAQVLDAFDLKPDMDLGLMVQNQDLSGLTARLIQALADTVRQTRPVWILAQGDTTTVLAGAMVSFYTRTLFGHVEAGLRTGDMENPFPEEFNRCVASLVADLHFAPTARAKQVLLAEGIPEDRVLVTGNTIVDAATLIAGQKFKWQSSPLANVPEDVKYILVTAHRRESFGYGLEQICKAIKSLGELVRGKGYHIVFPVHLNPNVQSIVHDSLKDISNIHLLAPLDYTALIQLLRRSSLILTDSGGIQEEAPAFKVPVLVMRDTTERPEGIDAGLARLVGRAHDTIVYEAMQVLTGQSRWFSPDADNPYGDGQAAARIVSAISGRITSKKQDVD